MHDMPRLRKNVLVTWPISGCKIAWYFNWDFPQNLPVLLCIHWTYLTYMSTPPWLLQNNYRVMTHVYALILSKQVKKTFAKKMKFEFQFYQVWRICVPNGLERVWYYKLQLCVVIHLSISLFIFNARERLPSKGSKQHLFSNWSVVSFFFFVDHQNYICY